MENRKVAIIGGGNIGSAIALGLNESKLIETQNIIVTRRSEEGLKRFSDLGMSIT
nr:NAD(P)-binding domain-containing protein [Ignavibacteriaceae bacterium]